MPETSYTRRVLITLGLATLFIVVLLFMWEVADVLLLVFAGVLVSVLLLSIANLLSRYTPLEGRWSFAVTLMLVIALLVGAGWFIGPQLANQASRLTGQISQPIQSIEQTLAGYSWGRWILQQAPLLEPPNGQGTGGNSAPGQQAQADGGQQPQGEGGAATGRQAQSQQTQSSPIPAERVVSGVTGVASTLITFLADLVLVVFVGIFLAVNPGLYENGVVRLFPHGQRARARGVLNELFRTLQGWLVGQLISMVLVGVLTGIGLLILGMPLVLVLAFLAFLLEFIPLLGPWLAAVPAVLIAFTQGVSQALWVALLYLIIQQIESNLIFPIIEKRTVSLPPALTLVAVFVMGALFGLIGVFVAAPLVAVVMVLVKMLYVHDVLGDRVSVPGRKQGERQQA